MTIIAAEQRLKRPTLTDEPTFTTQQLRNYIGERGYPMYIAYEGVVYDVTNCPKWRRGIHENQHWPGQDLTAEMDEAPHTETVFNHPCVKRVGRLVG
ncbi:cytochrome b5 [Chloroflexi bacterium TSY]|nr:cytochrome b5 [Chloroflexi bacterium TSY]